MLLVPGNEGCLHSMELSLTRARASPAYSSPGAVCFQWSLLCLQTFQHFLYILKLADHLHASASASNPCPGLSKSLLRLSLPSLVRPVSKSSCPDGWSLFSACELAAPQKPLQAHPPYFLCLAPHLLTSLTISLTAGEGPVGFIFFVLLMNSCCWRYFCSRLSL